MKRKRKSTTVYHKPTIAQQIFDTMPLNKAITTTELLSVLPFLTMKQLVNCLSRLGREERTVICVRPKLWKKVRAERPRVSYEPRQLDKTADQKIFRVTGEAPGPVKSIPPTNGSCDKSINGIVDRMMELMIELQDAVKSIAPRYNKELEEEIEDLHKELAQLRAYKERVRQIL